MFNDTTIGFFHVCVKYFFGYPKVFNIILCTFHIPTCQILVEDNVILTVQNIT